jgi:hypothetical protein
MSRALLLPSRRFLTTIERRARGDGSRQEIAACKSPACPSELETILRFTAIKGKYLLEEVGPVQRSETRMGKRLSNTRTNHIQADKSGQIR